MKKAAAPVAEVKKPEEPDRRRFIGGSDAAAVMGFGSFDYTPLKVYLSKISDEPEQLDAKTRLFLDRRKRWEPVVVQMLREEFDAEVTAVNLRYVDKEHEFLACEIDFEWRDPNGETQNGEIKTVSPFSYGEKWGWGDAGTADVPIHYAAQVQHGLMVTGRKVTILAAMVGLDNMIFYRIERDDEVIAEMRTEEVRFWNEHVLKKVPPAAQTIADLHKLYKTSTKDLSVSANSEIGSKALRLRAARANIEAIQLEMESLEFDIKLEMKDAEKLLVEGRSVFSWKDQNWARLDQESFKIKEPKMYREFYITGRHRIFKPMYGK